MKVTSIFSVSALALATAVSANHGQFDHASVAPSRTEASVHKPTHSWALHNAREPSRYKYAHETGAYPTGKEFSPHHQARNAENHHGHSHVTDVYPTAKPDAVHHWVREAEKHNEHEMSAHPTSKPTGTHHHYVRDTEKLTSRPQHFDFDEDKHSDEKIHSSFPIHEFSENPKPTTTRHWARSHEFVKPITKPAHTGGAAAGKPGHHFVREAARAQPTGNPYGGTRFTPGSAIDSVRGILTGNTGIKRTCDRCVAAMEIGQSLAQQSSHDDFSKAVTELCKQVHYRSDSGCETSFGPSKVGPYIETLKGANLAQDGKSFCKAYFNTC